MEEKEIKGINDIPTVLNEHKTNGMTEEQEELNDCIIAYYCSKNEMERTKELVDMQNKKIKNFMKELDIKDFETDNGLTAKITIQNRDSLNEPKAIAKLKELGLTSAIKTKEYLDLEEIENLIYNQKLNPSELQDCQIKKEVITLTVKNTK